MDESFYKFTLLRRVEHEDRPDSYHLIVRNNDGQSIAIREVNKDYAPRLRFIVEEMCQLNPERGAEYLYRHDQDTIPSRRV